MSARALCNAVEDRMTAIHGPDGFREAIYGKERWRPTLPVHEIAWEEVD